MLEKIAKSQTELLEIMGAVEVLGFSYKVAANAANGVFTYTVRFGVAAEVATPENGAQESEREPRQVQRRTSEQIARESVMIAEYLRNSGRPKTPAQIHEAMKLQGCDWKEKSVVSIIHVAMQHDANITKTGYGAYTYEIADILSYHATGIGHAIISP